MMETTTLAESSLRVWTTPGTPTEIRIASWDARGVSKVFFDTWHSFPSWLWCSGTSRKTRWKDSELERMSP